MSDLRLTLVALLVISTAVFAAGVLAERSHTGLRAEPAGLQTRESGESAGAGGQSAAAHSDAGETVLGVDVESTPLIVLAVIAGLALALLVAAPPGRRAAVLIGIAAIAVAWAALDVRELVHQIDEARTAIATLAAAVTLLHLAAAAVAARLVARERVNSGAPARPDTMPA